MADDYGLLSEEPDEPSENIGQKLVELILAGALIATTCFIMSALLRDSDAGAHTVDVAATRPVGPLPFAPALALRSALRDALPDETLATTHPAAASSPVTITRSVARLKTRKAPIAQRREGKTMQEKSVADRADSPLGAIGRVASAFASDFSRDFGRLPGQLSTILSGRARETRAPSQRPHAP